jgi:hypothetical protein
MSPVRSDCPGNSSPGTPLNVSGTRRVLAEVMFVGTVRASNITA